MQHPASLGPDDVEPPATQPLDVAAIIRARDDAEAHGSETLTDRRDVY